MAKKTKTAAKTASKQEPAMTVTSETGVTEISEDLTSETGTGEVSISPVPEERTVGMLRKLLPLIEPRHVALRQFGLITNLVAFQNGSLVMKNPYILESDIADCLSIRLMRMFLERNLTIPAESVPRNEKGYIESLSFLKDLLEIFDEICKGNL